MYQLRDLMKSKRHVGAGLQHIDKTDGNTIRQFRPLEWCSCFTCFLIGIPVSLTTSTCSKFFLILFSGLCAGFSTKDQMLKIYVATVLRHITEIIPLDRTKKESKGQFRV